MATMLAVETKVSGKVSFNKPLKKHLKRHYPDKESWEEDLIALDAMRDAACGTMDKSEAAVAMLWDYYHQLQTLDGRFPLGDLSIKFTWNDAFRGKKFTDTSPVFEKAAVLFNIAALLGQLGAMQVRSNVDGIKRACQFFQRAAGVALFLRDQVVPHLGGNGSPDLSGDALTMIANLNLAQAQETVYEKADMTGMKPSILSKVAAQAAEFYRMAAGLITGPNLSSHFHRSWPNHLELRARVFEALAQVNAAVLELENDGYGEEIARLEAAAAAVEVPSKMLRDVPNDVVEQFNAVKARIQRRLPKAVKENDTIYIQLVPRLDALERIVPKALVKPTEPDLAVPSDFVPLFHLLVPAAVIEMAARYAGARDAHVAALVNKANEETGMANSILASLNLPAAIEVLDAPDGLPNAVRDKAAMVRNDGGISMINDLVHTLNAIAEADRQLMVEIETTLGEEAELDGVARQQYGQRWRRAPSDQLTENLREELRGCHTSYVAAKTADGQVQAKLNLHGPAIETLMQSDEQIAAIIPDSSASGLVDNPAVADLRQLLAELEDALSRREAAVGQVREIAAVDDITATLMGGSASDADTDGAPQSEEGVFQAELLKYGEPATDMERTYGRQAELLGAIQTRYNEFAEARAALGGQSQREIVLGNLDAGFVAFKEVKAHLQAGVQFYTNFQDALTRLKLKVDDFCFARNFEKQDMLTAIQAEVTGVAPVNPLNPRGAPPAYGGGGGSTSTATPGGVSANPYAGLTATATPTTTTATATTAPSTTTVVPKGLQPGGPTGYVPPGNGYLPGGPPAPSTAAAAPKPPSYGSPRGQTCCVCLDEPATHAAIPCGHQSLCDSCKDLGHRTCPLCRAPVQMIVRIYTS